MQASQGARGTQKAPVIFMGHGAAIFTTSERDPTHRWMTRYADDIAAWSPRGFVVVSAHYVATPIGVTASVLPRLIHDHPASDLYAEGYPSPGEPALAREIAERLGDGGLEAIADEHRPLDHGAWLPLRHLRPAADLFVIEVSLPATLSWEASVRLGEILSFVRARSVVLLASGGVTHDQAEFRRRLRAGDDPYAAPPSEHRRFEDWVTGTLAAPDRVAELLRAKQHPAFPQVHPTAEHFLPLLVATAASGGDVARRVFSGVQHGLSTTAFEFGG